MSEFNVTIKLPERGIEETYRIAENSCHHTSARAALTALTTFQNHGLSEFPYNDGPLVVEVEEIERG